MPHLRSQSNRSSASSSSPVDLGPRSRGRSWTLLLNRLGPVGEIIVSNKPKPLPTVAMVRRGRRFESVRGLCKSPANVAFPVQRELRRLFAVPVVELGQTRHQADAAEIDLLRARVPGDVVRLARAVGEQLHPAGARVERVTDARARRARDHRAGPHRVSLLAEDADAVALEDDEELLLRSVAVHRAVELARRDVRVVEPGFDRTRGRAELARAVAELAAVKELRLDVLEPDDVRRSHAGLRQLRLGQRSLELPLVRQVDVSFHRNAKLGLAGRYALVCAVEGGMTLKAAAAAFSVSPATAQAERVRARRRSRAKVRREKLRALARLLASGSTRRAAARALGVDERTIRRWTKLPGF